MDEEVEGVWKLILKDFADLDLTVMRTLSILNVFGIDKEQGLRIIESLDGKTSNASRSVASSREASYSQYSMMNENFLEIEDGTFNNI